MSDSIAETYKQNLVDRLWAYRRERYAGQDDLFDRPFEPGRRPPVFMAGEAHRNVIFRPGADSAERELVSSQIPAGDRHRWFRSMASSQALAQSVFGNLKASGKLHVLSEIMDEDGRSLFLGCRTIAGDMTLEHKVSYLQEPRPTSIDALFDEGQYRIAVECKLSEAEVGSCSRPRLRPGDASYGSEQCDGTYTRQRGRSERCALSQIGVSYWRHLPRLLTWPADGDLDPCPLRITYQLVRNLLAACVRPDGSLDPTAGHAVLLIDGRNPAFQRGGAGWDAFQLVRSSLRQSGLLRLCTWQQVMDVLRGDPGLAWLADEVGSKYGL